MERSPRPPFAAINRLPLPFLVFSLGLWLLVFGNVLFGDRQFASRDESHFYYPLFKYIQAELEAGRFPLWTPNDNIGQPFFANAALGILYPGKLIFFLPLDYTNLYNIYIVGHVFLACLTLYRLARCWRIGPWGATFGALAYGFGGTVLGQYCNPIFLVGAAWVPEAVLWADRMLTRRRFRYALMFSAILSVMLLGGDPQAAFHVGMIASLLALFRQIRDRREGFAGGESREKRFPGMLSKLLHNRAVLLGFVVGTTFLLSAVQVLPSQEYSRLCNRAGYKNPRSIWEIPRFLMADEKDLAKEEILFDDSSVHTRKAADVAKPTRWGRIFNGIFHRGMLDSHQVASYNFSTYPAQFMSFIWPGIEGTCFPQNSSWFGSVFIIHKALNWFSTLYMGVVPFLLAIVSLRFRLVRKNNVRIVWLSWVLLIALWSGVGFYGFGWLLDCFGLSMEIPFFGGPLPPAVGGGYWMLQVFVPGYIQFRYPAKLITLAAFPMAMLAAYGFDRLTKVFADPKDADEIRSRSLRWFCRLCVLLIFVSLILTVPASMRNEWGEIARKIGSGEFDGPFLPELARSYVFWSLIQTAGVLAVVLVIIRSRRRYSAKILLPLLLLTLSADLYLSCKNYIILSDRSIYTRSENVVLDRMETGKSAPPVRINLNLKSLVRWSQESSPDRMADFVTYGRKNFQHQFHYGLPRNRFGNLPLAKVAESGTMSPYSYSKWVAANIRNDYRFEKNLMLLGAEYALMDVSKPLEPELAELVARYGGTGMPEDWPENTALWKLKNPRSRVWIEGGGRTPDSVETGEAVGIVHYEPAVVVIEAELKRPGTVVLSDQYWPGWQLDIETVSSKSGETVSKKTGTSRPIMEIFRGVDLPAGTFRLTYRYDPDSFKKGAILSGISWSVLILIGVGSFFRNKRRRRPRSRQRNQPGL